MYVCVCVQVQQVHKELMSSAAALTPGGDLEAVNRALPGLLYVDGQCLYGGKVGEGGGLCVDGQCLYGGEVGEGGQRDRGHGQACGMLCVLWM